MNAQPAKRRGRPARPFNPFEQADIRMAKQLRRWDGWQGAYHCGLAAFEMSMILGHIFVTTRAEPAFMLFRNSFRSYCNLWRGRSLGENWELPANIGLDTSMPTVEHHSTAFEAMGAASGHDLLKQFIEKALYSFVKPERKSASGRPMPLQVVLGSGPGEDPRGYGRKPLPVRYADSIEQVDRIACQYVESTLSAQLVALRMDKRGEDHATATHMHELLVLYHLFFQLFVTAGVKPGDWSWVPEFFDIYPELLGTTNFDLAHRVTYGLIGFMRLRREAGGAAGFPSLLYCEDCDCSSQLFYWPTKAPHAVGPKKGKARPPHLCPLHNSDQRAAFRKKRARALKRRQSDSKQS